VCAAQGKLKMDFQTFKKEKMDKVLNQFLAPDIINSYKVKYGIKPSYFGKDVSSYDDVYDILGYAFLFLGRAVAETISDVRVYESSSSPMKRFSLNDKEYLIHGAWYWVFNFKPDGVSVLPPTPIQYFSNKTLLECLPHSFPSTANREPNSDEIVIFGPIPFPELQSKELSPRLE
jgi:hypothetical protein